MSIFSLLSSKQLVPEWTYSPAGLIWRMIAVDQGTIVGECRDPERRTAFFFCVDVASGVPRWSGLPLSESWWVGIEAVHQHVLLLHSFASPDMPQHRGIWAVDVTSGKELWHDEECAFWFCARNRVVVYRDFFERRVGYELDLQTGAVLKTHDASLAELHVLRQAVSGTEVAPRCLFPEPLDDQADVRLRAIVQKETKGKEFAARVEHVESGGMVVFNYHVQYNPPPAGAAARLENRLAIYDLAKGKRRYSDIIGSNLAGYVPDSFFILEPFMLYIKDQQHLKAIRLWKS